MTGHNGMYVLYAISWFLAANACANLSATKSESLELALEIIGIVFLGAGLVALSRVQP